MLLLLLKLLIFSNNSLSFAPKGNLFVRKVLRGCLLDRRTVEVSVSSLQVIAHSIDTPKTSVLHPPPTQRKELLSDFGAHLLSSLLQLGTLLLCVQ